MSILDNAKRKGNKVYRGAYEFLRNGNIYCEETFEVFKKKNDPGALFCCELISRVATGELLKITVDYRVNKEFLPTTVIINKNLGNENVVETFSFNNKLNAITYTFTNGENTETSVLNTTPKFYISTPSVATSMLYLRSKKFDGTTKNLFNVLGTSNQWKYEKNPEFHAISVEKISLSTEGRNLGESTVQGVEYRVKSHYDSEEEAEKDDQALKIFVSQHLTLPYFIEDGSGTKIHIKYLNDLSDRELD